MAIKTAAILIPASPVAPPSPASNPQVTIAPPTPKSMSPIPLQQPVNPSIPLKTKKRRSSVRNDFSMEGNARYIANLFESEAELRRYRKKIWGHPEGQWPKWKREMDEGIRNPHIQYTDVPGWKNAKKIERVEVETDHTEDDQEPLRGVTHKQGLKGAMLLLAAANYLDDEDRNRQLIVRSSSSAKRKRTEDIGSYDVSGGPGENDRVGRRVLPKRDRTRTRRAMGKD